MTKNTGFFLFEGIQPLDFVGPWVSYLVLFDISIDCSGCADYLGDDVWGDGQLFQVW